MTYIKALSQSYSKFNWGFAWELISDGILSCLDNKDAVVPVETIDGEEYLGRRYALRRIPKENKKYTIDEETGEIKFDMDDIGDDIFENMELYNSLFDDLGFDEGDNI